MAGKIGDSLRRAAEATFTRKPPVSTRARAQFLVQQLRGTRAVAALLGVSQRTVERYLDGTRKTPPKGVAEALDREVKARWQPVVRARAEKRATESRGITVETRAQFGYNAAVGSTDDSRERRITENLPAAYAARLFEARQAGGSEEDLQAIIAEGLQETYFKDGGRRANGLQVTFTSIDYIEVDYH
ncbi:telomere-protecting terminal protein Tpg [Streptacidiphilus sp. PAMC 29251]